MGVRQDLQKIGDEFDALKEENSDLKNEVASLRFQLDQKQKDFETVLNDTKRSFKLQYKKHVKKYELKIQELNKRVRKLSANKENTDPINVFQAPSKIKINPTAPMSAPITHRIISSSPIKEIPSTQYSSDSETATSQQVDRHPPTDSSQDISETTESLISNEFDGLTKLTPLQRKTWLNNYYTNKYMNEPNFKISLDKNPITQANWITLDFKNIDRGEEETPPYMWIKDNTSQEDLIKQQTYNQKNKQLINKCFNQCLKGENKFHYEILNKYVKSHRYTINTPNE